MPIPQDPTAPFLIGLPGVGDKAEQLHLDQPKSWQGTSEHSPTVVQWLDFSLGETANLERFI